MAYPHHTGGSSALGLTKSSQLVTPSAFLAKLMLRHAVPDVSISNSLRQSGINFARTLMVFVCRKGASPKPLALLKLTPSTSSPNQG